MDAIVDNIYVVNMKKDVDRLHRFQLQCKSIFSYEIIEGVDVQTDEYITFYNEWMKTNNSNITYENFNWRYYIDRYVDLQKANINSKRSAWNHFITTGKKELRSCNPKCDIVNPGQLGCLLSHINILKDAVKNNYNSILILEDDIILSKIFETRIKENFTFLKSDWNILYFGAGQHDWNEVTINENEGYYNAINSTGTFAYMVNRHFYEILLTEFEKMKKPVDNYLIELQKKYEMKVLFPNIVYCDLEHSNISMQRSNDEWFKKFKWNT